MGNNSGDETLFEVGDDDELRVVGIPAGRSKVFRRYDPGQSFLMPPSLDDWLPQDHAARFVSDVVDKMLDLSAIYDSYVEASGGPPYDPAMMLKVLLCAYSTGVTSSREMERRCHVDVAFRWLAANTARIIGRLPVSVAVISQRWMICSFRSLSCVPRQDW